MRRAADAETRACRLLLPETFGPAYVPDLWVAIDDETGLLVGAAAVAWRPLSDPPGFPLHVHVPQALRRRHIGSALVEAVARACVGEIGQLRSWASISDDSPTIPFLHATGFAPIKRMLEFEAEASRFYGLVKAISDRFASARRVPESFRIVPLREAPADKVAKLVAEHFREASGAVLAGIARGASGQDLDKSVVLLDGETVRGALLYSWNDGDPVIDARVVAPEIRGSVANLLMLEAATRNGLDAGARRFRFSCEEDMRDTIKLARRSGATLLSVKSTYGRALAA
ncbi:MAG TPA: hypothetical protein VKZ79_08050 [Alphaproteobacteria bacterium]|nr:hypothetical protein [Alphaproteobacteria bacterium]